MNIQQMHIGLDLALQRANSNIFGKLQKEEKDYFLNVTTKELIRAAILKEQNTVFNIVTYADILKYYETLQFYIVDTELTLNENLGYKYVFGVLPTPIVMAAVTSGILYKNITYKVVVAGTTNLTNVGYKSTPVVSETFVCLPTDLTSGGTVKIGETYKVIEPGSSTPVSYGAVNNLPGTVFTATAGGTLPTDVNVRYERLTFLPTWAGSTSLIPITNYGYFAYLSSQSLITTGQPITTGTLTKGKKYIVSVAGTTNLSGVGGSTLNTVGKIFTCTSSAAITWAGGTILYEIASNNNRLVKYQDVENFLEQSYGSVSSSPIATIAANKLQVYHDFKFNISGIKLSYIKEPIDVNRDQNIDSDLPVSMHPFLVDTTAKYIMQWYAINSGVQQQQVQQ